MSKNTVIKEGGLGKQLTADKLKTNLVGGGSCLWRPKDEIDLRSKSISENGVYNAETEGLYGYASASVHVSSSGSVTGKGSDGNDYTVTVDDEGGLVQDKIPSMIIISTPPSYLGPYGDGAIISFADMVVTAYDADDNMMYDVNPAELILPVTVADYSQATGGDGQYDVTGLGLNDPVYLDVVGQGDIISAWTDPVTIVTAVTGHVQVMMMRDGGDVDMTMVSLMPGCSLDIARENGSFPSTIYVDGVGTIDGQTYYYSFSQKANPSIGWPWHLSAGQEMEVHVAAGIALLGGTPMGAGQIIPVQWQRPGDGMLLETSFTISVVNTRPGGLMTDERETHLGCADESDGRQRLRRGRADG